MTFQPILPHGGLGGWRFLQRTMDRQQALQQADPALQRAEARFRHKISEVQTAADLVQDRALRSVALQAFGLGDDVDNVFFIQKVLEGGTLARDSLANRLSDPRYAALADAFGFGNLGRPRTQIPGFADEILDAFRQQGFETAIGEKNADLRLALGLERELGSVLDRAKGNDARWFSLMGSPPLRRVFETALNLPSSLGRMDVDRQLDLFKSRAEQVFGSSVLGDFSDANRLDDLRTRFLLVGEANGTAIASSPALTLLSNASGRASAAQILQVLGSG
ncbi:DUF1217 domain-containing protein [Fluviibacterium sp. DFM31]|uniref:DUF1217 domain-containing protein n=1 Tax=Meridianimarinicoccus marinus TaxID=3231483 RepID=A0ABV3L346_9RHOB